MNRRYFLRSLAGATLALTGGLGLFGCRHEMNGSSNDNSQSETNINEILESVRAQYSVPALGGAVVQGSELVVHGAVGMRAKNGTSAVTADDLFHIGSCTKSMTATLVAVLVEEGVLSWETTIADVLPDKLSAINEQYHDVPISLFLTHRSGVPGDQTPGPYTNFQSTYWNYQGEITGQRLSLLEAVLAEPPARGPDTSLNYSNLGYIIAASFCEQLTGRSWEDLITGKLFAPLAMNSAGFGAPGTPDTEDQPWGHDGPQCNPISPGLFADNPPIVGPAGRVHLSLADWGKYTSFHLQGAQGVSGLLLSPSAFEVLHRDVENQGYAMGWVPRSQPWTNGTALWHNGSNTMWYAEMWVAPGADHAVMAVGNCASEQAFTAVRQATGKLIGEYI